MSHQADFGKIWTAKNLRPQAANWLYIASWNRLINYYNKVKYRANKLARGTKKLSLPRASAEKFSGLGANGKSKTEK